MVSIYQNSNVITNNEGEAKALEFRGLSSDTKPTQLDGETIENGSVFIEMDTQKVFFFDAENEEWKGE